MTGTVRVLPLLVVAGLCLFALKSMGLIFSGGYVVTGVAPASAQDPKADETKTEPKAAADTKETAEQGEGADKMAADDTAKPDDQAAADTKDAEENKAPAEAEARVPRAERAVLEGLADRRRTLDKRAKEIDLRENLLKAAEKRVEKRIAELKAIQQQIEGELKKQDDYRKEQYDNLVRMYSAMKPKAAARIFNRMELDVLTGLATQIKPRTMSAIMAVMEPAAAQRLTLELANRGKQEPKTAASLPKIESKKTN